MNSELRKARKVLGYLRRLELLPRLTNDDLQRLRAEYGAPESFTWQVLRRSCGTCLANAPGIFGAASAYRSAKQLDHSVQVTERHYVDVGRGIARDAFARGGHADRGRHAARGCESHIALSETCALPT